ncbi:hypothetical protein AAE478_002722 [Parahypoxylon ruwenzoriense]
MAGVSFAPTVSSTTVSIVYTGTASYEAVDVWSILPGETTFRFITEYWNSITTSTSTSRTSTTASSTGPTSSSTSSASPPTYTNEPSNSPGTSKGATAGIAVSCFIAGLILGAVAAFFLFRRRERRVSMGRYHVTEYDSQEKPLQTIPLGGGLRLDQFLLDSTSDAEIGKELCSLGHLLQQHVEENYHLQPVSRSANELTQSLIQLELYESDTMPAIELASLALDSRSRHSAIQHVIAKVTFASITFNKKSPVSLLPPPVSSFTSMIPATESYRGNPDAVDTALTRWRQLSAFLLHPGRSDRTPLAPSEDLSTHEAQKLAVVLNNFLEPFVEGDREVRYEQENHLREVIVECVTFGYLLFSQPSEYRFHFDGGGGSNSIVVFPGLDKISDEEGNRYPRPVRSVAPVIENL